MEKSTIKPEEGSAEERNKSLAEQADLEKRKREKQDNTPKVTREHDFTHTHPSHAKHKNFGMDHEPGAL
jgi:hypothetical protein